MSTNMFLWRSKKNINPFGLKKAPYLELWLKNNQATPLEKGCSRHLWTACLSSQSDQCLCFQLKQSLDTVYQLMAKALIRFAIFSD